MAQDRLNVKYNQIFTQNLLLFYWTCRHDKQKLFRLVVQVSRGDLSLETPWCLISLSLA